MKLYYHKKQIEYFRSMMPSLFKEHDGKLYCRLPTGDYEVEEVPLMNVDYSFPMEAPKNAVPWSHLDELKKGVGNE